MSKTAKKQVVAPIPQAQQISQPHKTAVQESVQLSQSKSVLYSNTNGPTLQASVGEKQKGSKDSAKLSQKNFSQALSLTSTNSVAGACSMQQSLSSAPKAQSASQALDLNSSTHLMKQRKIILDQQMQAQQVHAVKTTVKSTTTNRSFLAPNQKTNFTTLSKSSFIKPQISRLTQQTMQSQDGSQLVISAMSEEGSFHGDLSSVNLADSEGIKQKNRKTKNSNGRDLKAYTQRETPPQHLRGTGNSSNNKRNLLSHLQDKHIQSVSRGLSSSNVQKKAQPYHSTRQDNANKGTSPSKVLKIDKYDVNDSKSFLSISSMSTSQIIQQSNKNNLITPINSISIQQDKNGLLDPKFTKLSEFNNKAHATQVVQKLQRKSMNPKEKQTTKNNQPRNALVNSGNESSTDRRKQESEHSYNVLSGSRQEESKYNSIKPASSHANLSHTLQEQLNLPSSSDNKPIENQHQHRQQSQSYRMAGAVQRNQKFLAQQKIKSHYSARSGTFNLTPPIKNETSDEPKCSTELVVRAQRSEETLAQKLPPSRSVISQPRKKSFLEGFLSQNGKKSNTQNSLLQDQQNHRQDTMETVPNEHLAEKDQLSKKKPNQLLQRMKSKSELHSNKVASLNTSLQALGGAPGDESADVPRTKLNPGDVDDHNTVSGFYLNIQKSKFSGSMIIQNQSHRQALEDLEESRQQLRAFVQQNKNEQSSIRLPKQNSITERMSILNNKREDKQPDVSPERIQIKLQASEHIKSQTNLNEKISPSDIYCNRKAPLTARNTFKLNEFEIKDDFIVIPDPIKSEIEQLEDEYSIADTDEKSDTKHPRNELTVDNLIRPLPILSHTRGLNSSVLSESTPPKQSFMNQSRKIKIHDQLRDLTALSNVVGESGYHRNNKSAIIPHQFQTRIINGVKGNNKEGLAMSASKNHTARSFVEFSPLKMNFTKLTNNVEQTTVSENKMIKIIGDTQHQSDANYDTRQSAVQEEAKNTRSMQDHAFKVGMNKKPQQKQKGSGKVMQPFTKSLFSAQTQADNALRQKNMKNKVNQRLEQIPEAQNRLHTDIDEDGQFSKLPKPSTVMSGSASTSRFGGKNRYAEATQSFTEASNAHIAHISTIRPTGPNQMFIKTPSKAQQISAKRANGKESQAILSQQTSKTHTSNTILWRPLNGTVSGKKKSVKRKVDHGVQVKHMTLTAHQNETESKTSPIKVTVFKEMQQEQMRDVLKNNSTGKALLPYQPSTNAQAGLSNPNITPNILEQKKPYESLVIEQQQLHESFIKAMNFHRQANGNGAGTELASFKDKKQESETSDYDDGECKYETDDEGMPIYHPVVTETESRPIIDLSPDLSLTESNRADTDIPNEQDQQQDALSEDLMTQEDPEQLRESRSMAQYSIERHRRRNKFDSAKSSGKKKQSNRAKKESKEEEILSDSSKTLDIDKMHQSELNLKDLDSRKVIQKSSTFPLQKSYTSVQPNQTTRQPISTSKFMTNQFDEKFGCKDNRRLTLRQVLDCKSNRSTSANKNDLRSKSFVDVKHARVNQKTFMKGKVSTTLSKDVQILPDFSTSLQNLKTLYNIGATQAMAIGGGLVSKFPQQPTEQSDNEISDGNQPKFKDEILDTQVMNIEADFEQLDIGEEPIFERNRIKKTHTNLLKDKMSHLQDNYSSKLMKRQDTDRQVNRHGLSMVDLSKKKAQNFPNSKRQTLGYVPNVKRLEVLQGDDAEDDIGRKDANLADQVKELNAKDEYGPLDGAQVRMTNHNNNKLEMRERRRSNVSTYVERSSLFANAFDSLFGKDSLFKNDQQEKVEEENEPLKQTSLLVSTRQSRSQGRLNAAFDSVNSLKQKNESVLSEDLPYLLPAMLTDGQQREYTLVLDLDETLVHFDQARRVYKVRPLCIRFLKDLSQLYEIVIFTAAHETYANFILDKLDPDKSFISHRLYRQHTTLVRGAFVKDLNRLGRPLERTLIIDNLKENFERQKANGIECHTWIGSIYDRQLLTLLNFLTQMAADKPNDIRPHIAEFKKSFNKKTHI